MQSNNNVNGVHNRVTRLNTKRKANKVRVNIKLMDTRLRSRPYVLLKPLPPKLIKAYDKKFYAKYKRKLMNKAYVHRTNGRKNRKQNDGTNGKLLACSPMSRMRLWSNSRMNSLLSGYHLVGLPSSDCRHALIEYEEPEVAQISDCEYFRYLNVIKNTEMKRQSVDYLKSTFPLRRIDRSENVMRNECRRVVLNPNTVLENVLHKYQPYRYRNDDIRRTTEPKHKTKRFLYDFQRKYKIMNERKREQRLLTKMSDSEREDYLKKQYLRALLVKCSSKFAFSSPLGQRIALCLKTKFNELSATGISGETDSVAKQTHTYESYCSTKLRFGSSWSTPKVWNNWNCSSAERLCFQTDITTTDEIDSKYCHKYSFNRRQRLERALRLSSGLDWRARLLALKCVPLTVCVPKCLRCPVCRKRLTVEHCCVANAAIARNARTPTLSAFINASTELILKCLKPVKVKLERMLQIKLDRLDESEHR